MPWLAIETPMTRAMVERRFGAEIAQQMNFKDKGLVGSERANREEDRDPDNQLVQDSETGEKAISPFDTALGPTIAEMKPRAAIRILPHRRLRLASKASGPVSLRPARSSQTATRSGNT
jgi:hypothetical protein